MIKIQHLNNTKSLISRTQPAHFRIRNQITQHDTLLQKRTTEVAQSPFIQHIHTRKQRCAHSISTKRVHTNCTANNTSRLVPKSFVGAEGWTFSRSKTFQRSLISALIKYSRVHVCGWVGGWVGGCDANHRLLEFQGDVVTGAVLL